LVVCHPLAEDHAPIYGVDMSVWPRCDAESAPYSRILITAPLVAHPPTHRGRLGLPVDRRTGLRPQELGRPDGRGAHHVRRRTPTRSPPDGRDYHVERGNSPSGSTAMGNANRFDRIVDANPYIRDPSQGLSHTARYSWFTFGFPSTARGNPLLLLQGATGGIGRKQDKPSRPSRDPTPMTAGHPPR
jgi:hypothetical protein